MKIRPNDENSPKRCKFAQKMKIRPLRSPCQEEKRNHDTATTNAEKFSKKCFEAVFLNSDADPRSSKVFRVPHSFSASLKKQGQGPNL
jgi:hypothetical protein